MVLTVFLFVTPSMGLYTPSFLSRVAVELRLVRDGRTVLTREWVLEPGVPFRKEIPGSILFTQSF